MNDNNSNNRIHLPKLVRLLCLWLVMTALCLTVTRAWVSKNQQTTDSGLAFSLDPDLLDAFTRTGEFLVITEGTETTDDDKTLNSAPSGDILPGYAGDFFVGLYNNTANSTYYISEFGLDVPKVWTESTGTYNGASTGYDENPIKVDDSYYYLGKSVKLSVTEYIVYEAEYVEGTGGNQGKINLDKVVSSSGTLSNEGQSILPEDFTSKYKDGEYTLNRIQMVKPSKDIELGVGQALVFKIHLEFVNDESSDQSMFVGFGPEKLGGRCHRSIYATYSQVIKGTTE